MQIGTGQCDGNPQGGIPDLGSPGPPPLCQDAPGLPSHPGATPGMFLPTLGGTAGMDSPPFEGACGYETEPFVEFLNLL